MSFFLYLMKSVLCLALFYPFYMVLLSRETFHRFNRMALLGILLASAVIPVCRITVEEPNLLTALYRRWEGWLTGENPDGTVAVLPADWEWDSLMAETVEADTVPALSASGLPAMHWTDWLFLVYIIGVLFLLARHAVSIVRLCRLIGQGSVRRMEDGNRLCLHPHAEIAPFSWMNCIVLSEADYRESGRQIVAHEQAHIALRHSWDLLLVELCLLLQWFNPVAWLLRQELQNIHEYEADEAVIRRGIDAREYQMLIIKKAVGTRLYSLANSLNHSSLKKRLTMMMKEKSHPWARLKYAYVLPLAAASLVAFAHTEAANDSNRVSAAKGTEVSVNDQTSSKKSALTVHVSRKGEYMYGLYGLDGGSLKSGSLDDIAAYIKALREENPSGDYTLVHLVANENAPQESVDKLKETLRKAWVSKINYGEVVNDDITFTSKDYEPKPIIMVDGKVVEKEIEYTKGAGYGYTDDDLKRQLGVETIETVKVVTDTESLLKMGLDGKRPLISIKTKRETAASANKDEEVFVVVEQVPEYPGGMSEMMKYISRNIKYPTEARQKNEQGRVVVQFIVDKTGKLRDFKVVKSVSAELDAEALRVLQTMPEWTPGRQRGKAVNCKFTIPIAFSLNGAGTDEEGPSDIRVMGYGNTKAVYDEPNKDAAKSDDTEVFWVVEQMPEYPGGNGELLKYIQQNLQYPKAAQENGVQGRVVVQFIVDKTGKLHDFKVVKSVSPELDAEALRLMQGMPDWTPGRQRGKAVSVQYNVPLTFGLE